MEFIIVLLDFIEKTRSSRLQELNGMVDVKSELFSDLRELNCSTNNHPDEDEDYD